MDRPTEVAKPPYLFFALACALTWGLSAPLVVALNRGATEPPGYAVLGAGLSAFGPTFAALLLAGRGNRRKVFGTFRWQPAWVLGALLVPTALRTLAIAFYAATFGAPERWAYLPQLSTQVAALVVFPLGEEFGWRGYAYPLIEKAQGALKGSLVLGLFWGVWHFAYCFPPGQGFDFVGFGLGLVLLPLYSVILAVPFERSGRNIAVAVAFHAAAHIQHIELAPRTELGIQVFHVLLVAMAAALAARALIRARSAAAPAAR
jgi:uncharacterized protein